MKTGKAQLAVVMIAAGVAFSASVACANLADSPGRAGIFLADPTIAHVNGQYYLLGTENGSGAARDQVVGAVGLPDVCLA